MRQHSNTLWLTPRFWLIPRYHLLAPQSPSSTHLKGFGIDLPLVWPDLHRNGRAVMTATWYARPKLSAQQIHLMQPHCRGLSLLWWFAQAPMTVMLSMLVYCA